MGARLKRENLQRMSQEVDVSALLREEVRRRPRQDDVATLPTQCRSPVVIAGVVGLLGVVTLLSLVLWTSYTQRVRLRGALVGDLVEITAPARGVVVALDVTPGQIIHRGDRLFTTASDLASASLGSKADKLAETVLRERQQIDAELLALDESARHGEDAGQAQIRLLEIAREQVHAQRTLASEDLAAAKVVHAQISAAAERGIVSKLQAAEQRSIYLAKQLQFAAAERQQNELEQSIVTLREKIRSDAATLAQQRQQLQERRLRVDRAENDNEAVRAGAVYSSLGGTVREISVRLGETVQPNQRLATISTDSASLTVDVRVPGPHIAYIKKGILVQVVPVGYASLLRKPAIGRVTEVASVPQEPGQSPASGGAFRVQINVEQLISSLASAGIEARPGMSVDVEFPLRRRRIIELLLPDDAQTADPTALQDRAEPAQGHAS